MINEKRDRANSNPISATFSLRTKIPFLPSCYLFWKNDAVSYLGVMFFPLTFFLQGHPGIKISHLFD